MGCFRGHDLTAETTIPAIGTKSGRYGNCALLLLRTTGVGSTIMKFKLCCFLVVLAHSCLGPNSTHASEETDAWGSFLKIDREIPIITHEKARNPILRQKVSRTVVAYEKFRSHIRHEQDWMAANLAQGYWSQLDEDQQMLHSMIGGYSSSGAKYLDIDELDTVLDDLYLKVNACLLNGGKAVGSVSVIVHTKKSGIEIPNLRVVCMAKILRLYRNYSPTAFPQLSSPTKWELAPGNYLMWAENPETGEKSSTQEIPVDRNQECDLAVP
jgi:hypothetical protein